MIHKIISTLSKWIGKKWHDMIFIPDLHFKHEDTIEYWKRIEHVDQNIEKRR